jgi:hypothetical protein
MQPSAFIEMKIENWDIVQFEDKLRYYLVVKFVPKYNTNPREHVHPV